MARRKTEPTSKPDPTKTEAAAIQQALVRTQARTDRAEVIMTNGKIDSPHSDGDGHVVSLMDAFASRSHDFMVAQLGTLDAAGRRRGQASGESPSGLNTGLAFVGSVAPTNEVEAALAVQMSAVHSLASELLGRAKQSERTDHTALYGGLAVKLLRTFACQVEALAKLRGGAKQQVEVRHVYVNGNAVIGNVQQGGGEKSENGHQPHAPCLEANGGAALPSPLEAVWDPLQGTRDPREAMLQDARGEQSRGP